MRILFFIVATVFLAPDVAWSEQCSSKAGVKTCRNCSDDGMSCFVYSQGGGRVSFSIENQTTALMTYYLDVVELENMTAQPPIKKLFTLRGKGASVTHALSPKSSDKQYRWNVHYKTTVGKYGARADSSYRYRLPYENGTQHPVSQGYKGAFSHQDIYAVDFTMPKGTSVLAARDGVVVAQKVDSNVGGPDKSYINDANYIYIEHSDGTVGMYLHFKYNGSAVRVGQRVKRGDVIGYSGSTGFSTEPHLHFEVAAASKHAKKVTFPMNFVTKLGKVSSPKAGQRYQAVSIK